MPTTESRYQTSKTTFCQNQAQTTKTIKEMRACCMTTIWDTQATCAATIREVETTCAECTCILQQSHGEHMQEMEREAIEEEGRDHQPFLTACGVALWVCPPEAHEVLMYPLQLPLLLSWPFPLSHPVPWGNLPLKLPIQLCWQPPHPNGNIVHLGRRLQDQLLLPKSLLTGGEKRGSSSWGSKRTIRRPFARIPI